MSLSRSDMNEKLTVSVNKALCLGQLATYAEKSSSFDDFQTFPSTGVGMSIVENFLSNQLLEK